MAEPNTNRDRSIKQLLESINGGDTSALEPLFAALYAELRANAGRQMGGMGAHTLQPTALVNEAYVRIQRVGGPWESRDHFLLAASQAMRHVLVDHFRRRTNSKSAGERVDVELDLVASSFNDRAGDLVGLDEALKALAERDEAMARVVELRFFGGVPMDEIARIVDIPLRSLQRQWSATKSWLYSQLAPE